MKRSTKIVIVAIVAILVIAVFAAKRTGSGDLGTLQGSIDAAAHSLQDGRKPLEIEHFDPSMMRENEKPLIIVMGESWCQPCLRMMPDLTELHRSTDDVEVRYLDLGENEEAFQHFPIRVTPTIAVFEAEGKPFTPPADSSIDYIIYTYRDTGEHALTIHEGYLDRSQLDAMIEDLRNAG